MQTTSIHSKAASVEFRNVSKIYGETVTAVDGVSLKVEAGELVTLLGLWQDHHTAHDCRPGDGQ